MKIAYHTHLIHSDQPTYFNSALSSSKTISSCILDSNKLLTVLYMYIDLS